MDPRQKLFRKAALEKMASPERLDEMMEITAPKGWLALLALGLTIVGAIVWGIFGSISIKVQGQGILMRGEAVLVVTSEASGRVKEVSVKVGDIVEVGGVVATVHQPDLALRIENTEEELATLLQQREGQQASTGRILGQLRSQSRELQEKVAVQEGMAARGLLTGGTVLNTKAQLAAVEQQIAQQQLSQSARGNRLDAVQRELEELESLLEKSSAVKSPYHGRVLELVVDSGNLVRPGSRLLTLEALEGPVDAVIYIPAADGKKVELGMEVRVSPSTVRAEEFGFILAEVKSASVYPVTPEGIARVLRNENLVQTLAGEGAQIELVVQLIEDPQTDSGFRWTSAKGPPSQVFTGTLCTASVIIEKKRPISYVMPIFKGTVGIS